MLLQSNKFYELFAPGDSGGPATMTSQDILSELMDDDEKPEVIDLEEKPTKELEEPTLEDDTEKPAKPAKTKEKEADKEDDEEENKEEVDELAELEKELEGPDEKQLESMTPARRKDILKAYPDLFKKFPYLETAYYRDQKFTEYFPTVKEAEEATASLKDYSELQSKLKVGNIEGVITDIQKDEKAFYKMVDNYLPVLSKVAPQAYHHIVGNLIKHTVETMFLEGKTKNDDVLKNSAATLHQFIFGTTKWTPPTNLSQEVRPEDNRAATELQKREAEFAERRFNTAQSDVGSRVDNTIKATIAQYIDPKDEMTSFVKSAATAQALKSVESLIVKDARFKTLLDRLWQNAADKDFSKVELDKIKSACISKARTLLPSVIKTARHEALKGLSRKAKEVTEEEDTTTQPETKRVSAPRTSGHKVDKSKPLPGESSADFLLRD